MQFIPKRNRKLPPFRDFDKVGFFKANCRNLTRRNPRAVRRVAIHLLEAKLNHMDITIQYLNKGNISGGVPNLKHTAATKARYLVDGCKVGIFHHIQPSWKGNIPNYSCCGNCFF